MSNGLKQDRCKICGKIILENDENAVYQEAAEFGSFEAIKKFRDVIPSHMKTNGWLCGKCHERQDREMFGYTGE